ncbi:MAG: TldD/PmbA family protein [Alphaproteobacteria bacterium]
MAPDTAAATTDEELARRAVALVRKAGCGYGDIRICRYRRQGLRARDRSLARVSDDFSAGFGVRVLLDGAWGFAASHERSAREVRRVVALAVDIAKASRLSQSAPVGLAPVEAATGSFATPMEVDPFTVPLPAKAELLLDINERLLAHGDRGIAKAWAFMSFAREDKLFASTVGSSIAQVIHRTYAGLGCTAVANGDAQGRSYERPPLNMGYEHVDPADLLDQVERVAEEAIEKVHAPEGPKDVRRDLVLRPSHLWLPIHESVGHATELDRVYGYEANFAGTSFATPEHLGALSYAAPFVSFRADRTEPGGRSTVGYDDEGVPAQSWRVIENGVLVDYLTDRETAHRLGRGASNGCAHADGWASVPIVRIPNLGIEPGPPGGAHTASLAEMIADTREGILIDGTGSYSIDQQRRNFQFGGDAVWRIEGGKLAGMLKNLTYRAMTTDFWNRVDAVGPLEERERHGTDMCGKGEPMQFGQMTHAAVPVRVRDIEVG